MTVTPAHSDFIALIGDGPVRVVLIEEADIERRKSETEENRAKHFPFLHIPTLMILSMS